MARSGKAKARAKRSEIIATARSVAFRSESPSAGQPYPPDPDLSQARLTMQQEARNTERHGLRWSNSQLRHNKVNFISAGDMRLDELDDTALREVNRGLRELNTSEMHRMEEPPEGSQSAKEMLFFVDCLGDKTVTDTGLVDPLTQLYPSAIEDSSEDEVVFPGRNYSRSPYVRPHDPSPHVLSVHDVGNQNIAGSRIRNASLDSKAIRESSSDPVDPKDTTFSAMDSLNLLVPNHPMGRYASDEVVKLKMKSSTPKMGIWKAASDDEADIMADYIENMDTDYQDADEAAAHQAVVMDNLADNGNVGLRQNMDETAGPLSSNDLDRLDEMTASDELPLEIGRIFSKRKKNTGVQYLVGGKEKAPNEPRWIPSELLTMLGAKEQILDFEEREKLQSIDSDVSEHLTISSVDDGSREPGEHSASEEDEHTLTEHDFGDFTDEQIARALQTQDQLGLGLDEVFFDGTGKFRTSRNSRPNTRGISIRGPERKGKASRKDMFLSASALADALEQDPYGFDIMDFDRPSLRKKPKGRRQVLNFELSDSELELELESAWQNDRTKKKIKKQKRDELRSQGLLGRKTGQIDMKAKYSGDITIDNLKMEIKAFLISSADSLSLPPMNKKDRKLVHEIANAVSLKSQSRGNGPSRFPLLYKSSRTPKFTQRTISDLEKVFSRGRLNGRMGDRSPRRSTKVSRGQPGAAASYMDGDIVGASAPEIGAENKGRAMLEKMGWSTGTALGALNNKGILQPVAHVVKNSRAGLG